MNYGVLLASNNSNTPSELDEVSQLLHENGHLLYEAGQLLYEDDQQIIAESHHGVWQDTRVDLQYNNIPTTSFNIM